MVKRTIIGLFAALLFLSIIPKAQAQLKCSLQGLDGPVSVLVAAGSTWAVGFNNNMVSNLNNTKAQEGVCMGGGTTVSTGLSNPWGLTYDGTYIWVSNYGNGTVVKFNPANGDIAGTYSSYGTGPKGITWDGAHIWVVNSTSDTVVEINPSNGDEVASYTITSNGWDAAFDGTNVWVTSGGNDTITVINTVTSSHYTITDSGCGPGWEAFDGTHMWVGCYDSKSVRGYNVSNGSLYAAVGATGHAGVEGLVYIPPCCTGTAQPTIAGITWNGSVFAFNPSSPPADATFYGQITDSPNCYGLAYIGDDYYWAANWNQNYLQVLYF